MYQEFIRNRITQLRMKIDISERELSFNLGKSGNYINKITSGKSLPNMDSFFDICDFFEITPVEFFYPNMENPIASKKIYNEITRLSANELDKLLIILESINSENLKSFIEFIDKVSSKKWQTNK